MSAAPYVPAPQKVMSPPVSKKFSLADIKTESDNAPPANVLHAGPGWGKTSWAAQTRNPIFLMAKGETGLLDLIQNRQLPETAHFPELQTWNETLAAIDMLLNEEHPYQSCILDAGGGFERLMHEHVCNAEYGNEWGEKGFTSFQRGYTVSLKEWRLLLAKLDRVRREKRMAVTILCHTAVIQFKNPNGADYDRFEPKMHPKTWALTNEWATAVFFGHYFTEVETNRSGTAEALRKGKGLGGTQRVLYTRSTAAFEAKQRLGLPPVIYLPEGVVESAAALRSAIVAARESSTIGAK